jgi:hypothetical protein
MAPDMTPEREKERHININVRTGNFSTYMVATNSQKHRFRLTCIISKEKASNGRHSCEISHFSQDFVSAGNRGLTFRGIASDIL